MINLLPTEQKKTARHEYARRVRVLCVWFLFFLSIVGIATLAPPLALSTLQKDMFSTKITEQREDETYVLNQTIAQKFKTTKNMLETFSTHKNTLYISEDVFEKILAHDALGIQIEGIFYNRAADGNSRIEVGGIANTRTQLLDFVETLKGDERFLSVDVPISNFAQSRDVVFNIRIVLK